MNIKLSRIFILFLPFLLTLGTILPVHAQADSGTITMTLKELGYDDIRLKGLYGSNSIWIPFQSDWSVDDVQVQLTYAASPLLNSQEAILTILANDQEITSIRPVGDGKDHTVTFTIPSERLLPTGVNLTFDGHLRLTDEFCEDSFNTGQWLIVRDTSTIKTNLNETAPVPQLTDLPEAILVRGDGEDLAPVTFVLPDEPDDLTLTSAAQVAARLGKSITPNNLPINVAYASEVTQEQLADSNLVVIGMPGNQPLIPQLSNLMPVPLINSEFVSKDGVSIPDGDGVVQILNSPWRPHGNILVIGANDSAGLAMAGKAFSDNATFKSLKDSYQFVHALVKKPAGSRPEPWSTEQTTFADLGEYDRQVTGLGITDTYYSFQYPAGVRLSDGAQLILHIAFSPALRNQNSYAAVYLNDVYVGAINVNSTQGDAWVSLDLPVEALNELARVGDPRKAELKLSIANLLPTNNCQQIDKNSSWTKIYSDSYFQTSFSPALMPDLHYFPNPFASQKNDSPVRLVIPDEPNATELAAVLSTAALIGNGSPASQNLEVNRAGIQTSASLAGHEVILFGTLARNPLITQALADVNANAPKDVYQVLKAPQTGFFQESTSPWDEKMNVLAISGDSEEGFNAAVNAIYEQGKLVDESGSIAIVRPGEAPVVIYREAGLEQAEVVHPEVIQSASEEAVSPVMEAVPTSESNTTTAEQADTPSITGTERLILIITVFVVILVAVAALIRVAWRIKP